MQDRRHAAIMFTDIVGYTALMGRDEDAAFDMLKRNHGIHENLINKYNGTLIKEIGDGTLASFPLPSDAVRCAIEIQKEVKDQDIPLKIGIHQGEMVMAGTDVLGDCVNVASRLQEISDEGSIIISSAVYRDVKNKAGIKVDYIKEETLKNVDEPIKIYKVNYKKHRPDDVDIINHEKHISNKKSIIVLPFENLSPDPENAFFADGLTEELIAELCKIHSLLVISRTSAMVFKEAKKSIPEIAKEVNVSYVLEGSVRRAGNNLRISAQLIDASSDAHLWVERYSGTMDDIFDLQEKLASRIVVSMKGILSPKEKRKLAARPITNPYVYDVWLKAKNELWKFTEEGLDNCQKLLKNALEVVGENSLLYAGLGYYCWAAYDFGISYTEDTLKEGEKYAQKSLELDPEQPLAFLALGLGFYKRGDLQACTLHIKKALDLGSELESVEFLGFMLAEVGKIHEAHNYADLALASNPLSFFTSWSKACVHIFEGQFSNALNIFHAAECSLAPQEAIFDWWLAQAAAFDGKEDKAREAFERVISMEAGVLSDFSNLFIQAMERNHDGVKHILDSTILQDLAETDEWFPNFLANCLMQVGETEKALYYLGRAINWGFSNYQFLSQHNRYLVPLRGNSQFESLIEQAKEKQDKFIV